MTVTHVQLGGELTGRSIFGGNRNRLEWAGMVLSVALVVVLQVTFMRVTWTIIISACLLALAVYVWSPRPSLNHRSVMGLFGIRLRWWLHRRMGILDFAGGVAATEAAQTDSKPLPELPIALGRMRFFELELWPGRDDPGRVLIIRHRNHDQVEFLAVFEFRSRLAGVQDQLEGLRNHTGWARFQAAMARQGSLVRDLGQVSRIVPYDSADHVDWVTTELPNNPPDILVRSYAELIDGVVSDLEQNRTWLAVGIPATHEFYAAANRSNINEDGEMSASEASEARMKSVIATQLRTALSRGRSVGMSFRPLDQTRLAAVVRSMQDPDQPLDRLEDATLASMWLPWVASEDRQYVRVKGGMRDWLTRTAIVPRDGFAPGNLPVDQLVPLLTGISPAVIRTISTHSTLVPAATARAEARHDVTVDQSNLLGQAREVSDGTSEAQVGMSRQRLADLQPGSGVHGADWAMAITIQASTLDELEQATNQIEEAASDSNINILLWQDSAQHLALPLTLPLLTGVQRRRKRGL